MTETEAPRSVTKIKTPPKTVGITVSGTEDASPKNWGEYKGHESPKYPVLHDRGCNDKACRKGQQLVLGEFNFRGMKMAQLFCIPCKKRYSISVTSLR